MIKIVNNNSKNCIVMLYLGLTDLSSFLSKKSIVLYSNRTKSDLYLINTRKIFNEPYPPHLEKLQLNVLTNYEKVLYLDADIIISPTAPNIFNIYNNLNAIFAFDESIWGRENFVNNYISEDTVNWEISKKSGRHSYFNSGVMLFGKNTIELINKNMSLISKVWIKFYKWGEYKDQTYLNYVFRKLKIPISDLSFKYNYIHANPFSINKRYASYFIHYAGNGFSDNSKIQLVPKNIIINDYHKLNS